MGPAVTDNNTGGPFCMFNKNIEKQRRKFVAANTLEIGHPLNMDYCYERSRRAAAARRVSGRGCGLTRTKAAVHKVFVCPKFVFLRAREVEN
jgi:hypothetical protein